VEDETGPIARPVGERAHLAHRRGAGTCQRIVWNKIDGHYSPSSFQERNRNCLDSFDFQRLSGTIPSFIHYISIIAGRDFNSYIKLFRFCDL
jgi:hypothetical protein